MMKTKNYFLLTLAALGIVLTGCNKDDIADDHIGTEPGKATLNVKFVGMNTTRSTSTITDEEKINDFMVYVYGWNSNVLEASLPGEIGNNGAPVTTSFSGLSTATAKRVVVLANLGQGNYPVGTTYASLSEKKYDLGLQSPDQVEANGFFMSGASPTEVVLSSQSTVSTTVIIKRAVARVSLETIKIVAEEGHDVDLFKILGVSIQRASAEVALSPITSYYENASNQHYGGFTIGSDNNVALQTYLTDNLDILTVEDNKTYTLGNYFFVYPNSDLANCTLLTVKGEYNGKIIYYPVKINHTNLNSGTNSPDGNLIESNKKYELHLTLKKFGDGTIDPEVPPTTADLDVEVKIEEWGLIVQEEIW